MVSQAALLDYAKNCKASQDPFELFQLLRLALLHDVQSVLEIGVDTGWLMACWRDTLDADLVIGVDIITERFDDATNMRENLIVGDSGTSEVVEEVRRRLGGRTIDLLFIDGDHHMDATLRDFELYSKFMTPGGLVCLHDTSRVPGVYFVPGIETRPAFEALCERYPSIEIANGPLGDGAPGIGVLFMP